MLADDFETRLTDTFNSGAPEQQHDRRHMLRPLLDLAPIIRVHGKEWRKFQAAEDEGAWDAHLLFLGQRLSALQVAQGERWLERFVCAGQAGPECTCKGCIYIADLRSFEEEALELIEGEG